MQPTKEKSRLRDWSDLTEDVRIFDPALAAAVMSGRPSLAMANVPATLNPEQIRSLYNLVRVLLDTNQQLQENSRQLAEMVARWLDAFKGVHTLAHRIGDVAEFREVVEDDT